jgi:hypothetical protein
VSGRAAGAAAARPCTLWGWRSSRRDEAVALLFAVFDILVELRAIRRVLEDGGEEEEGLSN